MIVELKTRPLPVRLWLSYRNYRAIFGRWDSLRAAIELQWLNWRSECNAERSDEEYDGP